ncbi:MAG: alpha-galactosidase [Lacunisphaera sp.]|nr:alpha-galactosidase [Lacunisphaera sp.]
MKTIRLVPLLLASALAAAAASQEWPGITVEVKADPAVEVSQNLTPTPDGFHHLDIKLSNTGTQPVVLGSIEIRIPIQEPITSDMEIAYGSSCMGQRPVLIHKAGESQKGSESLMYAMLQKGGASHLFAGALSWRIFLPAIRLEKNAFVIRSTGEGKLLRPGETIPYERIVLGRSADWPALLDAYGTAIAKENGIKRVKDVDFKGWATWDYYAYKFSADDIFGNMEQIKKAGSAADLIQIDAGWYAMRGDYTADRPDLAGGMKAVIKRIKDAGMMTGLWLDGFRANTDSEVFKKHPEYFLHDQDGKMIVQVRRPEGVDRDRVYFDYSHPGARAHIAAGIRHLRENYGIPYFKIDFLRFGLNQDILQANPSVKGIKAHDPTITDVERMRLGLQVMREAVGPDNYLLGCSAVFGPAIGFVDGMRTGGDVSPRYEAFPERVLANAGNYYLHGKVFNVDADYLVFREAADEDEKVSAEKVKRGGSLALNEARMWADFNKLFGNCRLSSDNLLTLRPERQALVAEVFGYPAMDETIPLDYWQHGKNKGDGYELLLARHGQKIFLGIFNWSDAAKDYQLPAFGGVHTLQGRHSKIVGYAGGLSFAELRRVMNSPPTQSTP